MSSYEEIIEVFNGGTREEADAFIRQLARGVLVTGVDAEATFKRLRAAESAQFDAVAAHRSAKLALAEAMEFLSKRILREVAKETAQ